MAMKIFGAAILAAAAIAAGKPASATTFTGSATGSWGSAVAGSDNPSASVSVSNLDASNGGTAKATFGTATDQIGPNVFTFNGAGSDASAPVGAFSANAGQIFDIGRFTYFNGTTGLGTNIDSIALTIGLALTAPSDATPPSSTYNYSFGITVTPNTHDDSTPAGAAADADIVTISNGVTSTTFTSGGVTYTLGLLGFSTNGGASYTTSFNSPERTTATADIYAVINQPSLIPVPEPASMALLAGGLAALGAIRRRRS